MTQSDGRATTLVVEDDRDNREFLVRLLQRCGLLVDSAATVADALTKLSPASKVVLLDMHLPDGSGVAILKRIREDKLPISVGVVTGSGQPEILDELKAFTPDAVFVKPVVAEMLCKWVEDAHGD